MRINNNSTTTVHQIAGKLTHCRVGLSPDSQEDIFKISMMQCCRRRLVRRAQPRVSHGIEGNESLIGTKTTSSRRK
jgi:hypothetical protein